MNYVGRMVLVAAIAFQSSMASSLLLAQEVDQVRVSVKVALAVSGKEGIDPRLGEIRRDLEHSFRKAAYDQLDEFDMSLELQEGGTRALPGGAELLIQYAGITDSKITLNVRIQDKGAVVLDTNFSIAKGGTIIVGGPDYGEGNLVLAIKASGQ